ncbi:MAG: class I adenylate-forming enzyme family protein [Hyphomicrobiaceae bacterium]|jgi:acyl-CoA synthetase (AMP-forming)/AMP-acid ligase II
MRRARPAWLGVVPPTRAEVHFGGRVVQCFADRPRSTHALLEDALVRNLDGEAIVCGDARLTYMSFDRLVSQVAGGLAKRGVGHGDRVALLLGNDVAFPVVLFATLRLGAIAVPISIREQTPGLAYMLEHCGAKVLVHDADLADRLPSSHAAPALAHRIGVTPGGASAGLADLLDASRTVIEPAAVDEEDTAVILYTSGTTGRPKGAMLTHLGICHSALHYECCMGLEARDRAVIAVPMSHVTGVIALIAAMVRAAGTLIVMPTFKAGEFIALAERERMTHTLLVPAMYNLCLLEPRFEAADLSAWRLGGFGGAPMPTATIERLACRLPRLQLMNAYGATETTSPASLMPPTETAARLDSVGLAVPCGEILVMGEDGREVPRGAEGEVWLRGPMVVSGYWNDAKATAESFVAGYWRSGDIGSIDAEGYLRVFDRKKDMINRGGYKIYSIEVENVLMRHAEVVEAAVIGKPCPVLGERAHAVVCLKRAGATSEELTRHCALALADYKVPDSFSFRPDPLPRNANGKIIKRQLRDELLSDQLRSRQSPCGCIIASC